jgi:hypothetical protein
LKKTVKSEKNAKNRILSKFIEIFRILRILLIFGPRGPPIAIYRFIEISSPQKALWIFSNPGQRSGAILSIFIVFLRFFRFLDLRLSLINRHQNPPVLKAYFQEWRRGPPKCQKMTKNDKKVKFIENYRILLILP